MCISISAFPFLHLGQNYGVFFASNFTPFFPNCPLHFPINSEYTVKARAHFIPCICAHYQHWLWCRHLNNTADTVPKSTQFLAQKQRQRLKVCQDKSHSSLPSKWTNYGRFNLHPPIFQRQTQGTQFIFCWWLHKVCFSRRWLHTNCHVNKQEVPSFRHLQTSECLFMTVPHIICCPRWWLVGCWFCPKAVTTHQDSICRAK